MVTPEVITNILAQSLTAVDLEFCKELVFLYPRARVSRVWMAGTCFLYTRPINGEKKIYAFMFDMMELGKEYPENLADAVRRQLRKALRAFEEILLGRINRKVPEVKLSIPIKKLVQPNQNNGFSIPRGTVRKIYKKKD